jgi:hypothetical protein
MICAPAVRARNSNIVTVNSPEVRGLIAARIALASSRRYNDGPVGAGYQPFGQQRSVYDGRIQTVNAQAHYQPSAVHLLTGGYEFENENYAFNFKDSSDSGAASATNVTQKSNAFLQLLAGRLLVLLDNLSGNLIEHRVLAQRDGGL